MVLERCSRVICRNERAFNSFEAECRRTLFAIGLYIKGRGSFGEYLELHNCVLRAWVGRIGPASLALGTARQSADDILIFIS